MSYTYIEKQPDLVINKVSRSIYRYLQQNEKANDSELYIITDAVLDAANDRIINVVDPMISSDAANKHYVDNKLSNLIDNSILSGESYDLLRNDDLIKLIVDIGKALGATIENGPY